MKLLKNIVICGLFAVLCFSCETPISITIPNHENVLVIEGWIENGCPAVVSVSKSLSYYTTISLQDIVNSIDTSAIVTVSDDMGNKERLVLGIPNTYHIYGILGRMYTGSSIIGQPGHTYTLNVETNNKIYSAKTSIPLMPVALDSIYFNKWASEDTTALIRILFTDPGNEFNCYRFFTQIKDLDLTFSQVSIGTFDDLTFNGKQLNFELTRSPVSNLAMGNMSAPEREEYYRMYFKKGDVVYVKSAMVDTDTKNFWSSLQTELSMGANPFLTPGTHPTNIQGEDVTGIWSGYNARYDTLKFD